MSGAEALWSRETMGASGSVRHAGRRQPPRHRGRLRPCLWARDFVGTPRVGVRTSEYGQDYRLGYGVEVLQQGTLNLKLGVDAERRVSPVFGMREAAGAADQRVLGRASVQW